MTILEFWGCVLITFGPALAMFSLTIAHDPIKVILLISSAFFWLMSFLVAAICWTLVSLVCDKLFIGAIIAVLSQEAFRYLFHLVTKKAQFYLIKIMDSEMNKRTRRGNEIRLNDPASFVFKGQIPLSYVSGLGFGLMNAAFSLLNILTDYIGPGSVGLKGDSQYFLLVSSLLALAFILLNVAWSILMSESIEKSDRKLALLVLKTHLMATSLTLLNEVHLQLIPILVVYALAVLSGLSAFKVAGFSPMSMISIRSNPANQEQRTQ